MSAIPSAVLFAYVAMTLTFAAMQGVHNITHGKNDISYAPVWWIALTWPVWLVVIALDLPWSPHYPENKPKQ